MALLLGKRTLFLMTMLATFSARITDWKALLDLHSTILLPQARGLRASRYCVLRNAGNAAEVLIIAELSTYEDAQEMAQIVGLQLLPIVADEGRGKGIWEGMGWEEIG
jgi:hypothetical protein